MTGQEGTASPDFSAILGKVMENPTALSLLTNLIGSTGNAPPPSAEPASHHPQTPKEDCASSSASDRRKLLLALKPFVSPKRREAIDRILQASELVSLFHKPASH